MKDLVKVFNDLKKIWDSMTPKARKITASVLGVFILILVIRGCAGGREGAKNVQLTVRAMKVVTEDLQITLDYAGDIKARDEAMVYPKVGGKIIEKVKEDGSAVTKGDTIAYVDRDEVGFKFEKAPVESPLTGVVGRVYVDIGTQVSPQTAVAFVVDMTQVKILLNVPEKYLPKIELGQKAEIEVDSYSGEKFTGTVTKMSPVVDIATRTSPIEITIDNASRRLRPGMFAKVRLVVGMEKNVPLVRKEAVLGRGDYAYVYVAEGGVARKKNVGLGMRQGAYYGITSGIKEGDVVIVMGQQKLRDGAVVKVEMEPGEEGVLKERTGEK